MTIVPITRPGSSIHEVSIAFNRDELIERPPAIELRTVTSGSRAAILPLDPVSDGTWIAVNDAGICLALLNASSPRVEAHRRSRGTIIPWLLSAGSVAEAAARTHRLEPADFEPFRLVILDRQSVVDIRSDTRHFSLSSRALRRNLLFTSSRLGDEVVEPPRRRLFEATVLRSPEPMLAQQSFHRHQWSDRPELGVRMSRAGARTVSHSWIELRGTAALMTYEPLHGDAPTHAAMDLRSIAA